MSLEEKLQKFDESVSTLKPRGMYHYPERKEKVLCPNKCGGQIKIHFRVTKKESKGCRCPVCRKTFTFKRKGILVS